MPAQSSRAPHRRSRPRPGSLAYLLRQLDQRPGPRGAQFERICRWYLLSLHARQLKNVWLWSEWPDRPGADCGIDLVAETFDGELWAVQCKAVAPDYAIRKREIDSFLAEANQPRFARRLLIATTDVIGPNARRVLRAQASPVEVIGRSQLGASGVSWPRRPDELEAPAPVASFALKQHQREALDAIARSLTVGRRGQVIMACGTGKTLVAIKARSQLRSSRTVVLVPSLALIKQTIVEWIRHSDRPFSYIAVCSDRSVNPSADLPAHFAGDLGVQVTTDGEVLQGFCKAEPNHVVFATYQSSPVVASACAAGTTFDLAIADEAHWAAGALDGPHATVLCHDAIRAHRRLFMTATPRRLSERLKREAGSERVASMDDATLFGEVLHRLSFGEAIRQQLLADYRVVVCLVDDQERLALARRRALVRADDGRSETADDLAAKVLVARAMRTWDVRRLLTFHARVDRARAFAERLPGVVGWMVESERPGGRLWARHIHGQMPSEHRRALLSAFAELAPGERGVVSNVRCLTEGVDVPSIDAVAILDPKRAHNEIIQAIGRALRTGGQRDKIATIVVPVFVPDGTSAVAALDGSAFEAVWNVLEALRDHDDRLADEFDDLRLELGPRARGFDCRPDRLILDLPQLVGPDFVEAFNAHAVRELGQTRQRQMRTGRIPAEYGREADGEHFRWYPEHRRDDVIDELGLDALRRFRDRTGHSRVPPGHREEGFGLQEWIAQKFDAFDSPWNRGGDGYGMFTRRDQIEAFRELIRPEDLSPNSRHLMRFFHPCGELERFRSAIRAGSLTLPSTVSLDDFPPVDSRYAAIYRLLTSRGLDATERLAAEAVTALGTFAAVATELASRPAETHDAYLAGFEEGLRQVTQNGCILEHVEELYGRKRGRPNVDAHIDGWDFAKKFRS